MRAARTLFAEKGFGGTGTEEIVALAGVTRGALYHQYKDKRALFLDVFEHVDRQQHVKNPRRFLGQIAEFEVQPLPIALLAKLECLR